MIAELFGKAAARGIDLSHVGGIASNTDGIARRRDRTRREIELGIDVKLTSRGRPTHTWRRPAWSLAELGQASKGMGPLPWAAAMYSFAGASGGYLELWNALAKESHCIARREAWPMRVLGDDGKPHFYRETLALLVLDEDRHRHLFTAAPPLFSVYMEVTPAIWESTLSGPFRSLKSRYDGWLTVAKSVIRHWINEQPLPAPPPVATIQRNSTPVASGARSARTLVVPARRAG